MAPFLGIDRGSLFSRSFEGGAEDPIVAVEAVKLHYRPMGKSSKIKLVLVTGMAGAGRASALHILEDMGFESVDNLPLALLTHLLQGLAHSSDRKPIAIGIDSRTRDFSPALLKQHLRHLKAMDGFDLHLLFLDCEDEILRRRFTETRRLHPMAPDRPIADGIVSERALMGELKQIADVTIDTSDFTLAQLKKFLAQQYGAEEQKKLLVSVLSFSFKAGLPREADLVFDVRFLKNPHYVPELKALTGNEAAVAGYIESDAAFQPFFAHLIQLLEPLFPRFEEEGKSYLTIAIGCTGGRHRSVFLANRLAEWVAGLGHRMQLSHRELEKEGLGLKK